MIEVPRNVRFEDGLLSWTAVPYASGYNIHVDGEYLTTVSNAVNSYRPVPVLDEPHYQVNAWTKKRHTSKSLPANVPYKPEGRLIREELFGAPGSWFGTRFPYWDRDTIINNELQRYVEDAFTYGPDGLTIHARKQDDGRWTSGCLHGPVDDDFTYGFFEAEIQFQIAQGLWPAFWLLNKSYVGGSRPEIDIMEMVDGLTRQTYHWFTTDLHANRVKNDDPPAALTGFHKYGVLWEPNRLTFFIDRMPVFTTWGDHIPDQGMYPILNLAIGGDWPGDPDPELDDTEMKVRSFRVWQ